MRTIWVLVVLAAFGCGDNLGQRQDAGGDGPRPDAMLDASPDATPQACAATTDPCGAHGACTDVAGGGYTCTCDAFYENTATTGGTCVDINECDDGVNPCGTHGTCNNQTGAAYTCTCDTFYESSGGTCVDVNECDDSVNPCGAHGTCNNQTDAIYTCTCNTFYENTAASGGTCVDANECDDGANPCGANGTCNNQTGAAYTCTCDPFYEDPQSSGGTCVDVNECDDGVDPCTPHGQCNNETGAPYSCFCDLGYADNGTTCVNIDECSPINECGQFSTSCIDTDGSYTCTCLTGYVVIGGVCVDDACDPDPCNGGVCTAPAGVVSCSSCPAGKYGLRCEEGEASLANYQFNGLTATPAAVIATSVDADLGASDLSRDVNISATSGTNVFASIAWATGATGPQIGEVITITLTPTADRLLTLTGVSFPASASAQGPTTIVVRSSLTGGTNLGGPTTPLTTTAVAYTYTFATPIVTSVPVTLQIFAWGATSGAGSFRLGDGTVAAATNKLVVRGAVTDATP